MALWGSLLFFISMLGMGAVAFLTLLERKILGMTQYRLGPNKVTMTGTLQPVFDGIKLLMKASFRPANSQMPVFVLSPMLLMIGFLWMWGLMIPWSGSAYLFKNLALILFCFLAIMAYAIILAGWSSTSGFSKMGSLRGILQSLSYEVALILVVLWSVSLFHGFSFVSHIGLNLEMMAPWVISMFILSLMEGNRAPFDLLEGESELISGFNVEMGSLMFVYLFLSEYGMIIFMSAVISCLLMKEAIFALFMLAATLTLTMRSCYPRVRYDSLMGLMWKSVLPIGVFLAASMVTLK